MVCEVELSTTQSRVELWPLRMVSGEAENCTIRGRLPALTVTPMLQEVVVLFAPVAVIVYVWYWMSGSPPGSRSSLLNQVRG